MKNLNLPPRREDAKEDRKDKLFLRLNCFFDELFKMIFLISRFRVMLFFLASWRLSGETFYRHLL